MDRPERRRPKPEGSDTLPPVQIPQRTPPRDPLNPSVLTGAQSYTQQVSIDSRGDVH